jgi:hypothetical protein
MSETFVLGAPESGTGVVVVDMSALRVQIDHIRQCLTVAVGVEPITVVPLSSSADLVEAALEGEASQRRELVFHALDRVLASGRLTRLTGGVASRLPVALYNPYTAEVAIGPVPATQAFSAGAPLPLPAQGLVCELRGDELIWPDGTVLCARERTFAQMTRVFTAHLG